METTRLTIAGLEGATDTEHVEKALEAVSGVQSVEVDPQRQTALVQHEGSSFAELATALRQLGYDVAAQNA